MGAPFIIRGMAHKEEGNAPLEGRIPPGSVEVERWGRVKKAFFAALERPESERNAFVARLYAGTFAKPFVPN
ncbi:MAG: hypothetical protein ABIF09_06710 [Gemmatimonadota bacterium]